ncbi:hypothetical protein ACJRO7_031208 [Eucalyptus globulus]|uniref:Pentatricopeptide repeat-containing protein n=1 Tax=Eucalyptus globulus TaxID=34317 RepID=A0ABD3JI00_EUCGL
MSALVDTGASDLFISKEVAKKLHLPVEANESGWLKTVNSREVPTNGMARGVEFHLGPFTHQQFRSSEIPSQPSPNYRPTEPGNCNTSQAGSKAGPGPVYLENIHDNCADEGRRDEFAADVEKIYRILRNFHSRAPKMELALQESGIIMRSGLTERVLNRCGDAGNLGYSFFVWASKQPGYRHSYDVYKAMVRILGKMRHFGAVWALLEEMRKENPQLISPELFIILMRRFASSRMVKKAIEVLDEMPKYGCEPDEYAFGCLLDALCKNGSVKEAAALFGEMKYRFTPGIKHFTSLLYGWCREGKLLEAKHVGYARAHKMADAYDLLKEMKRKGCEPNTASYTTLIQALCSREKMEEAARMLLEMHRSNCEADGVTYATLISGFCKCGHTPCATTYLPIMLAHEKNEELEECLEFIEEMKKIGCVPDISNYNVLIRLACKLAEIKEGVELWNQMETSGLSPGLDSFVIMIHGLMAHGHLVEACDYFKEMVGRGLLSAPNYGTLKDLLNSLLRAEKLEMAKDVWNCIVTKGCDLNVYAWTIWIHALFSNGHVKEACSYCLDMMDADVMPQPDTFAKLVRGLRKLYNRQIAAEITEKVRKMAVDRQITFKMYIRRGERDLKEKIKAKGDGRKTRAQRRRRGRRPGHAKADISSGLS